MVGILDKQALHHIGPATGIAGKDLASSTALMLAAAMTLDHVERPTMPPLRATFLYTLRTLTMDFEKAARVRAPNQPGMPALMPGPAHPDAAALRAYKAQVRFYTFFAVPVAEVYVSCGGDIVSERIEQAR